MVVIRLARGGAKKRPFYHVVAADHRRARDGRYIERLGYFNPVARGQETELHLERERINHWLSVGAQPSARVASLLKQFDSAPSTEQQAAATKTAKAKSKAEPAAVKPEVEATAEPAAPEAEAKATEAEAKVEDKAE